jgi:hypothetical protein
LGFGGGGGSGGVISGSSSSNTGSAYQPINPNPANNISHSAIHQGDSR